MQIFVMSHMLYDILYITELCDICGKFE